MPQPTGSDLYVNPLLTNVAVAFLQSADDFVAHRVFPVVPVDLQGGLYTNFPRGAWFRSQAKRRAPGTESSGSGWEQTRDPYLCEVFAHHKDVADQDRANDQLGTLDPLSTMFVTRQLLLEREISWVTTYFANVWTGLVTGVGAAPGANQFLQWNDANSDPIRDITNATLAFKQRTGFKPNKLTLGPLVENELKNHPDIVDRIKYTQKGVVTRELLASLFDVQEVLVPFGVQNTGLEGEADAFSFIAGKSALLSYAPSAPGMYEPSAGYTFGWRGYLGSVDGTRVKKFRMEKLASDRVEGESAYTQKLVSADCGTFFATAVA